MPRPNDDRPPREFIALDSSHLATLARDARSRNTETRKATGDFLDFLSERACIPLLCLHHFEELLRHRDSAVVAERIAFFRSLGMVAWIAAVTGDDAPGSIIDILAFEAAEAFKDPAANVVAIRDRVTQKLFRCGSGREAVRPYVESLDQIQDEFREREERSREVIAISRSRYVDIGRTKVIDWLSGRWRPSEDAERRLAGMRRRLMEDIRLRGDRRIKDAAVAATEFLEDVRVRAEAAQADGKELSVDALLPKDIDLSEIAPDMTIDELGDLAVFRRRLRLVNKFLGLPWSGLKERVTEGRLPSGLLQSALRRYAQDLPERKGSDLIDGYLLCLAPYADVTYVDKRTHEAVNRARRKSREFALVTRRIEKAARYEDIARQLGET